MYLKDILKCSKKGHSVVKMAEGQRKEELTSEFSTLNEREKDYIVRLTRALSSVFRKLVRVSPADKTGSRKKRKTLEMAQPET